MTQATAATSTTVPSLAPLAGQTVAITGESTELTKEWLASLTTAIDDSYALTLANVPDLADRNRFPRTIKPASDTQPTIFIGLGDTFEMLLQKFCNLSHFGQLHWLPLLNWSFSLAATYLAFVSHSHTA